MLKSRDSVYNRKFKILKSNNMIKIVYKEYKNILGGKNQNIDDYNLKSKLQELKATDPLLYEIINSKEEQEKQSNKNIETCSSFIRQDNIIRSRNKVYDLAFQNENRWKSFITLTFADNISDIDYAYKKLNIWLKQIKRSLKRNNDDFYYLGVIEFQKRGAIHYHLLTNLECNSNLLTLQENKDNMYDVKYWSHGYTSAFDLTDTDDNFNCAKYMCKYMTKKNDDNRLKNHRRYYHSRNLEKPLEVTYMDYDIQFKQLLHYLNTSTNLNIINTYHHIPTEKYQLEFDLIEFEGKITENELNAFDIINSDLEF